MPWPSCSSCSRRSRLRRRGCGSLPAVIAPLRHPLVLARELGTLDLLSEGRLVVQPTVSWHRDEYEALGVPFSSAAPSSTSTSRRGRDSGATPPPRLRASTRLRGRLLRAQGLASRRPTAVARRRVGAPTPPAEDRPLCARLSSARPAHQADLMLCGRALPRRAATSRSSSSSAAWSGCSLTTRAFAARACDRVHPGAAQRGFTTFCIKPSQFVDDLALYPAWCREVVERVGEIGR